MTMKRLLITLVLSLIVGGVTELMAQGWLKRLGRKVEEEIKERVEDRVVDGVGDAVDGAFDEAGEAISGDNSSDNNRGNDTSQPAPVATGDTGSSAAPAATPVTLEATYAKCDFVAGDEIFFEDNQANEQLGEFPSQWDMDYGNAEIVQMGGDKCIMTMGYTAIMPLIGSGKNYFPEQFTIEFDIYPQYAYETESASGAFEIGFNDSRTLIARFHNTWGEGCRLHTSWRKPNDGGSGSAATNDNGVYFSYNQWHHVAISFNKRACKIYVDGVRVVNIPNMAKPTSMWIWSEEKQAYFKNFRIAKGAVPLYDRMISDGKFITYGITFDVGKSTIKPESMGEINRIVQLMTENPELKFSVEGHTDNTGNPTSNQTLSEARAKAIVDKLVELGIAPDRLSAVGKGQTSPIADNTTDEGRAKNRRVEFVKQ